MRGPSGIIWGALALALLAGCTSDLAPGAGETAVEEGIVEALDLQATKTTGLLVGLVVDERIAPVAEAAVALEGTGLQSITGQDGFFGFDGLQPGAYLVTIRKVGYDDAMVEASVMAGDEAPPLLRVQLFANASAIAPFVQAHKLDGFIQCTGNPVALCSLPNNYRPTACGVHAVLCYDNVTEDNTRWHLAMLGNTSFLQGELVWKASSSFSNEMAWKAEQSRGCDGVGGDNHVTYGRSPLLAAPPIVRELRIPGGDPCTVVVQVSAGGAVSGGCVPGLPLLNTVCPGVAFQQQFSAFLHFFYGYLPPEGWRFSSDGEAAPP